MKVELNLRWYLASDYFLGNLWETPTSMTSTFFRLREYDIIVSKKHEKILLQILFLLHDLSKERFVF